jgi:thiamine biosynthesis lipoprotein
VTKKQEKPETPLVHSGWASVPDVHRFAHQAMATTFEIIIQYPEKLYAQQAADAAFAELDRLEADLSRYMENSDIARINHLPAGLPLQLGLETFECLRISAEIHAQTSGVFDVTIGFLLDCWLDEERRPREPSAEELEFARTHTGMNLLVLDEKTYTVTLTTSPVQVDLGGVGMGLGVDRMAELLREWSIDRALIHGGFSSVLALDAPQGAPGWPVTLSDPNDRRRTLARLQLERVAVSGSGLEKGRHIVDPRVGRPVEGKVATWSIASDAGRADALSTAFMIMSPEEVQAYCARHPDVRGLLVLPGAGESPKRVASAGVWKAGELID